MIRALMGSPQWQRSAYILTYDEHGGYFDHVRRRRSTPTAWASACRRG